MPQATSARRTPGSSWSSTSPPGAVVPALVLAALVCLVLLYFGLVPLGQWQADEYADFADLAQHGWSALWQRLHWSPRPFSELLFYGYGFAANHLRRPLIAPFLAILWCGLLAVPVSAAWRAARESPPWTSLYIVLALVGLVAAFLTGAHVFEVFYWPAGAVAYLPTLASSLLLFFLIVSGRLASSRGRLAAGVALAVAALSSEMGAVLTLCFAAMTLAFGLAQRIRKPTTLATSMPSRWLLIPLLLSIGILGVTRINRYQAVEGTFRVLSPELGNPVRSASAAALQLLRELVGWTSYSHGSISVLPRLLSELLIAAGVALCLLTGLRLSRHARLPLLAFALSLWLACFFVLSAAYLHSGAAAGERHETVRRCWILLSLSGIAVLALDAAHRKRSWPLAGRPSLGPVLLAVGVLMVWHVKPLLREYAAYGRISVITARNFEAGYDTGSGQMLYVNPPHTGIITAATLPAGDYAEGAAVPDFAGYILRYFDKRALIVRDDTLPGRR